MLGFSSTDVADIVKASGLPLIFLDTDGDSHPNFKLAKDSPTDEFFAISHAWADSLGNSHADELPRCQCNCLIDNLGVLLDSIYEINGRETTASWRANYFSEE